MRYEGNRQCKYVKSMKSLRATNDLIAVMGDLNDGPDRDTLSPLLGEGSDLTDTSEIEGLDFAGRPGNWGIGTAKGLYIDVARIISDSTHRRHLPCRCLGRKKVRFLSSTLRYPVPCKLLRIMRLYMLILTLSTKRKSLKHVIKEIPFLLPQEWYFSQQDYHSGL